ncbi:hypothetical protein GQ568_00350 [Patescibacteria group bacterium]|nr:hypothetical protein [Patescibacteria group bacterium]
MKKLINKLKSVACITLLFMLSARFTSAQLLLPEHEAPKHFSDLVILSILWLVQIFILIFMLFILLKSIKYVINKSNDKKVKTEEKNKMLFYLKMIIILFMTYFVFDNYTEYLVDILDKFLI